MKKPGNRSKKPGQFTKGKSGNPSGRPKLDPVLKALKEESLSTAIQLLHDKIHDKVYIKKLAPHQLLAFLETVFDRFGLPKATKAELVAKLTYEDLVLPPQDE